MISARFLYRGEAAPRRSLKWRVTYRRGSVQHFGAVWTCICTIEVNKWERGLESTETEVNIEEWGLGFSSPNPLGQPDRPTRPAWCAMCVNDFQSVPLLFIPYRTADSVNITSGLREPSMNKFETVLLFSKWINQRASVPNTASSD